MIMKMMKMIMNVSHDDVKNGGYLLFNFEIKIMMIFISFSCAC